MPIEDEVTGFLGLLNVAFGTKLFLVLFLIFYAIFALILFRQIQLMARKLPTPATPVLQFVGILHIGVALALLFIVIGVF